MSRGNKLKPLAGKLWELRFRGGDLHFRFVYFVQVRGIIVILHGRVCEVLDARLEVRLGVSKPLSDVRWRLTTVFCC
jgi:hypothetical protein